DHEMAAGEKQLAVTVAAVLPFAFAGLGVETNEDVFVEAVHVTLPDDRTGELGFEAAIAPQLVGGECVIGPIDFEGGATGHVGGGEKEAVAGEHGGLGDGAFIVDDVPERAPALGAVLEAEAVS